jgi:uncharacterized RDD family membrane protein YckC
VPLVSGGGLSPAPGPPRVVGRRIGAALLDLVPGVVLFLVLGDRTSGDGTTGVELHDGKFLLWLGLVLLYYFATEAAWGATPGKLALGLRVAKADGSRAGAGAIAARTLLRLLDGLPFLYLVGFVAILVTPARQRLGDLAAGTVVVPAARD